MPTNHPEDAHRDAQLYAFQDHGVRASAIQDMDASSLLFHCQECLGVKPRRDMRFVFEFNDRGCCNDCAAIPEIAIDWEFDDE